MTVLFHYALVDDLIKKEEFTQRVEKKIEECGDLIDEPTAAMLVVGELGRAHVKIQGLFGKSSLFSFFAKVLDKTEVKEFDRADGERGAVATLLVGDETGTARVVLWDERAAAVEEIALGDVLEIIGRHSGRTRHEIYALAMRKSTCDIACNVSEHGAGAPGLSIEPVDLDVLLVALEEPRTFTRRDGTKGEMVEAVIADENGTARLVTWTKEILAGIPKRSTLHITGAKPDGRGEGRAYSLDGESTVAVTDMQISLPFTPIGSVGDKGTYSVQGDVKRVQEPRAFTTRDGRASWVRNIVITDGQDDLNVVLWGEKALLSVVPCDKIEVYHATAKPGRFGGIELGAGRGSAVILPKMQSSTIVFEGTVIASRGNTFIDNGDVRYLTDGGGDLPVWQEVQVQGTVYGDRIKPEHWEALHLSIDDIREKAKKIRNALM
jgi:replication factor A1